MSVQIEIVGADGLRRQLGRIPGRVRNVSRKAMALALGLIHRTAVDLAPFRFGRLRNSLFWDPEYERQGNTIVGAVGTNVHYAPHQEFGTRFMSGKPFLRPAVSQNLDAINSIFASEIGNALHG